MKDNSGTEKLIDFFSSELFLRRDFFVAGKQLHLAAVLEKDAATPNKYTALLSYTLE